jgi:DNA modification methylase
MTTLHLGDNMDALRAMPDASIDVVITDPPYGLSKAPDMAVVLAAWLQHGYYEVTGAGFMGKAWDATVPQPAFWREVLRVLKPGAHCAVFAAPRTQDLMGLAARLAGFEVRDCLAWVFGSGMPKGPSVDNAIDEHFFSEWLRERPEIKAAYRAELKAAPDSQARDEVRSRYKRIAGLEREVVGTRVYPGGHVQNTTVSAPPIGTFVRNVGTVMDTAPATPEAAAWEGWGTGLRPCYEPILILRKPLAGTVAANVLRYGTGAMNIDACRIEREGENLGSTRKIGPYSSSRTWNVSNTPGVSTGGHPLGGWPGNLIHDGSEEATAGMPDNAGRGGKRGPKSRANYGEHYVGEQRATWRHWERKKNLAERAYDDVGSAARYFPECPWSPEDATRYMYRPKASGSDRDYGLDGWRTIPGHERCDRAEGSAGANNPRAGGRSEGRNPHPTVKPIALMRWLVRLLAPPNATILDPFMGSGSTGVAATLEGRGFIGCEMEPEYMEIAQARIRQAERDSEPPPLLAMMDL